MWQKTCNCLQKIVFEERISCSRAAGEDKVQVQSGMQTLLLKDCVQEAKIVFFIVGVAKNGKVESSTWGVTYSMWPIKGSETL